MNDEIESYLQELKDHSSEWSNDDDISAEEDAETIAKEIRKKGIWNQYSPLLREYHNREN